MLDLTTSERSLDLLHRSIDLARLGLVWLFFLFSRNLLQYRVEIDGFHPSLSELESSGSIEDEDKEDLKLPWFFCYIAGCVEDDDQRLKKEIHQTQEKIKTGLIWLID